MLILKANIFCSTFKGCLSGRSLTAIPCITPNNTICDVFYEEIVNYALVKSALLSNWVWITIFKLSFILKTLISDIQKVFCACKSCKDSHPFDNPLPFCKMQRFSIALTSCSKTHSAIKLINTWKINFWHCIYSSFSKCLYVVISQRTLPPPEIKTNPVFMRCLFSDFSIVDHGLAVPKY